MQTYRLLLNRKFIKRSWNEAIRFQEMSDCVTKVQNCMQYAVTSSTIIINYLYSEKCHWGFKICNQNIRWCMRSLHQHIDLFDIPIHIDLYDISISWYLTFMLSPKSGANCACLNLKQDTHKQSPRCSWYALPLFPRPSKPTFDCIPLCSWGLAFPRAQSSNSPLKYVSIMADKKKVCLYYEW